MKIRQRLTLILIIISLIPIIIYYALVNKEVKQLFLQEIGGNYEVLAREKAFAITAVLKHRVEEAVNLSKNKRIINVLQDIYATPPVDKATITKRDKEWIASKGNTDIAIKVLYHPLSVFLREYVGKDPLEYGEIFITDKQGLTIAMTTTTTDYYQADEGWWQQGYAQGKGEVYVDDRGFDLSVNSVVTGVLAPVMYQGKVLGVIKINFRMTDIPAIITNPYKYTSINEPLYVALMRSRGDAITDTSQGRYSVVTSQQLHLMQEGDVSGWEYENIDADHTVIMAYAKVITEKSIYSRLTGSLQLKGITEEGWEKTKWYVFLFHDAKAALGALMTLKNIFISIFLIILWVILIISFSIAVFLIHPIEIIRATVKNIAEGNLQARIHLQRDDELGLLSKDINNMVQSLYDTMVSRNALQQEIVQRQNVEKELYKLAQVVEQSPNSIMITNKNAEIEYVNKAFINITGFSLEEVKGKKPSILHSGRTTNDTYRTLWEKLNKGFAWKGEFHNQRKDGSAFIEEALVMPIYQNDGVISHYAAVKEDIMDKKIQELELTQYRNNLEQLVETRTYELKEALIHADAANQAKSEFLATMNHEVCTPMNAIIGLTYILKNGDITAMQRDQLQQLDTAANHLLHLFESMIDLSKVEAGQLSLNMNDFYFDSMLNNIKTLLIPQCEKKHIQFTVSVVNVPDILHGDMERIRQVLRNLLNNAIKFTEQGKIDLRIDMIESNVSSCLLQFEVEDTGIGMDKEHIARIFNAFEQLDSSISRSYNGVGLGLTICHKLIALMGGQIEVKSTLDKGSLFRFRLWIKKGKKLLPQPKEVKNNHLPIAKQTLSQVVEDNKKQPVFAMLDIIKTLLENDDATVNGYIIKNQDILIKNGGENMDSLIDAINTFQYPEALLILKKFYSNSDY